jgi:hypothetical protein
MRADPQPICTRAGCGAGHPTGQARSMLPAHRCPPLPTSGGGGGGLKVEGAQEREPRMDPASNANLQNPGRNKT